MKNSGISGTTTGWCHHNNINSCDNRNKSITYIFIKKQRKKKRQKKHTLPFPLDSR